MSYGQERVKLRFLFYLQLVLLIFFATATNGNAQSLRDKFDVLGITLGQRLEEVQSALVTKNPEYKLIDIKKYKQNRVSRDAVASLKYCKGSIDNECIDVLEIGFGQFTGIAVTVRRQVYTRGNISQKDLIKNFVSKYGPPLDYKEKHGMYNPRGRSCTSNLSLYWQFFNDERPALYTDRPMRNPDKEHCTQSIAGFEEDYAYLRNWEGAFPKYFWEECGLHLETNMCARGENPNINTIFDVYLFDHSLLLQDLKAGDEATKKLNEEEAKKASGSVKL